MLESDGRVKGKIIRLQGEVVHIGKQDKDRTEKRYLY